MRSRTIREGSVGLLILVGLAFFGVLVIWLRGLNLGTRSYRFSVAFTDVAGMQVGAAVRYRGFVIGKIVDIQPDPSGVVVEVQINSATLAIPEDSTIQVNQSGLIGETSVDITPPPETPEAFATNPLAPDCATGEIICAGDFLQGDVGVSFGELINATIKLSNLFGDEAFFNELRTLARNTADAAEGIAVLSREVTGLTRTVDRELTTLAAAATRTTQSVGLAADQLGITATQVTTLLEENRLALAATLNNISTTSEQLSILVTGFTPLIENGEFLENLEALSENSARASEVLLDLTTAIGSTENLVLLQQTLESARATFENAQKITADLDELTGDPAFRENLRELIDGLNNLVSLSNQLQHQTQYARVLEMAEDSLERQAEGRSPEHATPAATSPAPAAQPSQTPTLDPVRLTLLDPEYRLRFTPLTEAPSTDLGLLDTPSPEN